MNIKTVEELNALCAGKKITKFTSGCSICDDAIGIGEIHLERGLILDLYGAADCVMVWDVREEDSND